jgi:hypothetical protein
MEGLRTSDHLVDLDIGIPGADRKGLYQRTSKTKDRLNDAGQGAPMINVPTHLRTVLSSFIRTQFSTNSISPIPDDFVPLLSALDLPSADADAAVSSLSCVAPK